MRIVTKHLTKEVLVATAFVLLALVAIFAFFDLVGQANRIGRKYDLGVAIMLTVMNLPIRIYEIMPIAALLGAVFTLSRWAASSEFTILRVSGLSPAKLAVMMAAPAAVMMILTYSLGEWVAPEVSKMRGELLANATGQKLTAKGYYSGVWVKDVEHDSAGRTTGERVVNVGNLIAGSQSRTGAWRVFEFDAAGDLVRIIGAKGAEYIPGSGWHLDSARVRTLPKVDKNETVVVAKSRFQPNADLMLRSELRPDILGVMTVVPESMGIMDLTRYLSHLKENRQTSGRYEIALWNKIFYPLAIFVMLAVAMPFAYLNARSGGVSAKIFVGLMIGITFYALNNIFSFIGVLHTWPPIVVALFPSVLMLILASCALWFVERR